MSLKIQYPKFLKNLSCVGVTAPSSGLGRIEFEKRFDLVVAEHQKNGIKVKEGRCLRSNENGVSAIIQERIIDFWNMWDDTDVELIHPPWGGEILIELLEFLDFDRLKNNPKWVQGYSDISTLLFAITTKTGIATAHGTNFMDSISGQDLLTSSSRDYLLLGEGKSWTQYSSLKWQKYFTDFFSDTNARFKHTEKTEWKVLNAASCNVSGRLIGGCLDAIREIAGTPYGDLCQFHERYAKEDGLILYLENCDLDSFNIYRSLMTMKYLGWFDKVNAIVFGRNRGICNHKFTYYNVMERVFKNVNFPVVLDADIGHKAPQMTIINGSYANLKVSNGKAELKQSFI